MAYTDPDDTQVITSGDVVTTAWLNVVAADLQALANPPRCRVFRDADYGISDATVTPVAWNAEQFDTDTMHSTSSNTTRLTAVTAGRYEIKCRIVFQPDSDGVRTLELRMNGSGGELIDIDGVDAPDATEYTYMFASGEVELDVGDYIEAYVYQTSGGSLSAKGHAGRTLAYSWISARWIGE